MQQRWRSFVYAFYDTPQIRRGAANRKIITFRCANKRKCTHEIGRYLDKLDKSSTSNLHKHVRACWGVPAFEAGKELGTKVKAYELVVKPMKKNGTLTAAFDIIAKGKPRYSNVNHTKAEIR
jgi:hypothetical protein